MGAAEDSKSVQTGQKDIILWYWMKLRAPAIPINGRAKISAHLGGCAYTFGIPMRRV
jgi:hypothetical protein